MEFSNQAFEKMIKVLLNAAKVLESAEIEFMVGGSVATWVRGAGESSSDIDFMLTKDSAKQALAALGKSGYEISKPDEGWLYKAEKDGFCVDLIFSPIGIEIDSQAFQRAEELNVYAKPMLVMTLEDVFITKLLALKEHDLNYESILEMARALREQVNWEKVAQKTKVSPYARAFFFLLRELGVIV